MAAEKPPRKKAKKDNSVLKFCIFGAALLLMLALLILSNTGVLEHLGQERFTVSADGLTEYQKVSCYDAAKVYYGDSSYCTDRQGEKCRLDYDKDGVLQLATYYNEHGDAVRVLSASDGVLTAIQKNEYTYDAHGNMTRCVSTGGRLENGYAAWSQSELPVSYAYTYDDSGNMTQKTRTSGSGRKTVTAYKNTYDAGALSAVEAYDESGALTLRTEYGSGGVKKSIRHYEDGELTELEEFDARGFMTRHLFYQDGKQQLGDGSIYTYDWNPDGSIKIKYDASDDSKSYNYYYVYEYPQAGS
jgi:hypothetical protein